MERENIIEQLATGKMSRRQFNRNLMALGATMVMMPLGSRFTQAASKINDGTMAPCLPIHSARKSCEASEIQMIHKV